MRRSLYEIEDAGRWTLISNPIVAGNEEFEPGKEHRQEKDDETLEKLVSIYLHRWGVISRKVLAGELLASMASIIAQTAAHGITGSCQGRTFYCGHRR